MQRVYPVVIRLTGETFIPKFPVELEGGDTLIVAKEMRGSRVPTGEKWTVNGIGPSGPIISNKR